MCTWSGSRWIVVLWESLSGEQELTKPHALLPEIVR
jgi:hypothetical protein